MQATGHHMIQQQFLELTVNGTEQQGLAVQQQVTDLLLPALERVLAQYDTQDQHLYIAQLELDLGSLDWANWETALADKVQAALGEKLQDIRYQLANHTADTPEQVRLLPKTADLYAAFAHFLVHGVLPWHFKLPQGESLEALLYQELEKGEALPYWERTLQQALRHRQARRRLALVKHRALADWLAEFGLQNTQAAWAFWAAKVPETAAVQTAFLTARWDWANNPQQIASPADLLAWATPYLPAEHQARATAWAAAAQLPAPTSAASGRTAEPAPEPGTRVALYLPNAGLVLLHPFLPMLFEYTGIAQNDQIAHTSRALLLLHYLCTGQTEAQEHELALAKVLCGLPIDAPVDLDTPLLEYDLEQADAVLASTIKHWGALGDASPDGLRGAFLWRNGKLEWTDAAAWQLTVERQTLDILLNQLPWSIGMVKTPWMPAFIHVDWF